MKFKKSTFIKWAPNGNIDWLATREVRQKLDNLHKELIKRDKKCSKLQ